MKEIKTVGILGAGTMGSGIAQNFANTGYEVVLFDIQEESLKNARGIIENFNSFYVKKDIISKEAADKMIDDMVFTSNLEDLKDCDLIVEAIVEILEVKRDVFKKLDEICKEETIFASNTSSLSISEISTATNRLDKFIGMHFFNPVPKMKLVEMISTITTSEETKEAIITTSENMGKKVVRVEEAPGFIVNRILIPFINEGIKIYSEGTASVEDIDTALKYGANHPMGPLELGDLIGLDVCLNIMDVLYEGFEDHKYKADYLLRKMVAGGKLGRKTGEGFYKYK